MNKLITPAPHGSLQSCEPPIDPASPGNVRSLGATTLPVRAVVVRAVALPLILLALSAAGCTAEVTTARPAVATVQEEVVVDNVPTNIYAYPRTVYRGEPVYYVDGRWYHRRGPRWSYYRHEPRDLVRHRQHVEVAPPARRYQPPPGEAIRVR